MAKAANNVLIMVPKRLRLDWVDAMALDRSLSHVAFRAGCIIGKHFNSRTGMTFVGLPGIARLVGCSERTAWNAVQELEKQGWLLVEHKRGRSRANEYRPAVDRERATPESAAEKLAASCRFLKSENSQSDVIKPAADCDPTLNPPTEGNPASPRRARMERALSVLGSAGPTVRRLVADDDVFVSWFPEITSAERRGTVLHLLVKTNFARGEIENRFAGVLIRAFGVKDIEIRVAVSGGKIADQQTTSCRSLTPSTRRQPGDENEAELPTWRLCQAEGVAWQA